MRQRDLVARVQGALIARCYRRKLREKLIGLRREFAGCDGRGESKEKLLLRS